ncbi:MAG: hypothetical protein V4502_07940, partial [Pseudomonadota bacterium]
TSPQAADLGETKGQPTVYLVPRPSRAEPRAFPVYSHAVCHALLAIRKTHDDEELKLSEEDRRELSDALQVLSIAALLELQIAALRLEGSGGD